MLGPFGECGVLVFGAWEVVPDFFSNLRSSFPRAGGVE